MTNSPQPGSLVRIVNALLALALSAFILASYWPLVQLLDLSRADLQYEGVWQGGHARLVTSVATGGVADRAGLRAGDVLEFDPAREADWILATYRPMPDGFSAALPVRHADGTRSVATIRPERVAYLPSLNDRMALVARLIALSMGTLLGVIVVWARPSLMAWSLLLAVISTAPIMPWRVYYLAFEAGNGPDLVPLLGFFATLTIAVVPFALCFPRNTLLGWPWWKKALAMAILLPWIAFFVASMTVVPFERDTPSSQALSSWTGAAVLSGILALAIFWRTYTRSDGSDRARLKWGMLGLSAGLFATIFAMLFFMLPTWLARPLTGSGLSPLHWTIALSYGFFWPLALGYAILRQRVVDIQFAVSRTLVYGAATTLVLITLAAVHWLLGKLIEQTHLAIGLEGVAAIGLGLVLHRATRTINGLVDQVLFRRHHEAEERLRRVTAALPFATEVRSLTEALVTEPVRNLDLASAALFYRESGESALRRVRAEGWSDGHVTSLDADMFLVRYLQAEHEPLILDDPHLLPECVPQGAALPVLAVPIVNQHVLTAVVLYGAHTNSTLPDPDEIVLLEKLAEAAAVSHQQVRIGTLSRDVAALRQEVSTLASANAAQRQIIAGFEAAVARGASRAL